MAEKSFTTSPIDTRPMLYVPDPPELEHGITITEKKIICSENPLFLPSNSVEVSGFYYDAQMSDPNRTITLHPSTRIVKASDGTYSWKSYPDDECFPEGSCGVVNGSVKYSKQPLAVCFLTDDINLSASNDFSDVSMGNAIESTFNQMKTLAPLMQRLTDSGLVDAVTKSKEETGGLLTSLANTVGGWAGDMSKFAAKNLNNGLFVQGSRFTMYNGSSFNFNNLEMKFIRFSDWYKDGNQWTFIPVTQYISTLSDYCYGKYKEITADNVDEIAPDSWKDNSVYNDAKKFITEFFGRQIAPGGYEMGSGRILDMNMKGTLRLNIGNTYAIENLVIKNMNAVLSKVQTKIPYSDEKDCGKICPLYAEITLSLSPASKITDRTYENILSGKGLTEERKNVQESYKTHLDNILKDRANSRIKI